MQRDIHIIHFIQRFTIWFWTSEDRWFDKTLFHLPTERIQCLIDWMRHLHAKSRSEVWMYEDNEWTEVSASDWSTQTDALSSRADLLKRLVCLENWELNSFVEVLIGTECGGEEAGRSRRRTLNRFVHCLVFTTDTLHSILCLRLTLVEIWLESSKLFNSLFYLHLIGIHSHNVLQCRHALGEFDFVLIFAFVPVKFYFGIPLVIREHFSKLCL